MLSVIGFIANYQIASTLFIAMELSQISKTLHMGFHGDPLLALCFLLCASIIFVMLHKYLTLHYMLAYFLQHENVNTLCSSDSSELSNLKC